MFFNALQQSEKSVHLLQSVFDAAVDGIIIIDERGIIEYINNATLLIFGYSDKELIGQKINLLMPKYYQPKHDTYIKNYLETNEAKIIGIGREVKGLKKDGSEFEFFLSVNEVAIEGKRYFTGMVHDLTAQKKSEKALIALNADLENKVNERTFELNQALEKERELNQLKSRFVSMASHEFRTPLSTILSSASLMASYTKTEHQDRREKHFHKIKSSIEQLSALLNDVLSISKIEEGKVKNDPHWFDFNAFYFNFTEEMQGILKVNQQLEHEGLKENMQVFLDKKLLKIVLSNLVSNAIKYSDEGKTILSTFEKCDNQLKISVKDEGIGIPTEDQIYLFDRFFRAHNVSNIQGTGLGLNITKKYVEIMGGTIFFQSKENEGSIFSVLIPMI